MADAAAPSSGLNQAVHQRFFDALAEEIPGVADAVAGFLRAQQGRKDLQGPAALRAVEDVAHFELARAGWIDAFSHILRTGDIGNCGGNRFVPTAMYEEWSVLDDDQMQHQLLQLRLRFAIDETCKQEKHHLALRLERIPGAESLEMDEDERLSFASSEDLASCAIASWQESGLTLALWERGGNVLASAMASGVLKAFQSANQVLVDAGILPHIDFRDPLLRPRIRNQSQVPSSSKESGSPTEPDGQQRPENEPQPLSGAGNPVPRGSENVPLAGVPLLATSSGTGTGASPVGSHGDAVVYVNGVLADRTLPSGNPMTQAAPAPGGTYGAGVVLPMGGGLARPGGGGIAFSAGSVVAGGRSLQGSALGDAHGVLPAADVIAQLHTYAVAQAPIAATGQAQGVSGAASGMLVTVVPMTQLLGQAGNELRVQAEAARHLERSSAPGAGVALMLAGIQAGAAELKKATPVSDKKAVIELVSMMFEQILAEDRLSGVIRILLARLQVSVLRVALDDDEFFANQRHPARVLIDRIGSCALGFDPNAPELDVLEAEVKRVVEVIESYPETGYKVFEVALAEFEGFLKSHLTAAGTGIRETINIVEQIQRKATLVIQYTIELRKLLEDVPCHAMVRQFMLQIWPQVMAMAAIREGKDAEAARFYKRVALQLLWATSAKVDGQARTEALRKMPALLQGVRQGMQLAQIPVAEQDECVRNLGDALAMAFRGGAKSVSSPELEEFARRLAQLENALPEIDDQELPWDADTIELYAGIRRSDLDVARPSADLPPSEAALARVMRCQPGQWFERRGAKTSPTSPDSAVEGRLQLAWVGRRGRFFLFSDPTSGRGVLFERLTLAAAFDAQTLLPLELEPLTLRASRQVLARVEAHGG